MPQPVFVEVAEEEASSVGSEALPSGAGTKAAFVLARRVAWRFMVSRQAASIRLETLGLVQAADRTVLPL